jgi:hypothetical protein
LLALESQVSSLGEKRAKSGGTSFDPPPPPLIRIQPLALRGRATEGQGPSRPFVLANRNTLSTHEEHVSKTFSCMPNVLAKHRQSQTR